MFKFLAVFVAIQVQGLTVAAPGTSILTPHLQTLLKANPDQTYGIFVTMKNDTSAVLQEVESSTLADRTARLNYLHDNLVHHAETTQAPILGFLKSKANVEFRSFWISNQIYVKKAPASLIFDVANQFGDIVKTIDEEEVARLIEPVEIRTGVKKSEGYEWGVEKIEAPEAWEHIGGIQKAGEGIVVGTCDTGVRVTHEALRDNYLGDYGWHDPSSSPTPLPTDNNGHGTHTTGIIVGSNGIGVAPKAKWSACRGCSSGFCPQPDLLACAQFFVCPTLINMTARDCSKAPNLVSNSWGGGRGNKWYDAAIAAYHIAKIIPLFSIGNSGPSCNTVNSPGDRNVIGVGSTTIDDEISYFSSVGPTVDGKIKPEITAPGSDVISAYNTADDAYASLSGTSMACPHAAGTIALLQTREKDLNYIIIRNFLALPSDKKLKFSGRVCNGVRDNEFPNHVFGYGRINALKSVRVQTAAMMASISI